MQFHHKIYVFHYVLRMIYIFHPEMLPSVCYFMLHFSGGYLDFHVASTLDFFFLCPHNLLRHTWFLLHVQRELGSHIAGFISAHREVSLP